MLTLANGESVSFIFHFRNYFAMLVFLQMLGYLGGAFVLAMILFVIAGVLGPEITVKTSSDPVAIDQTSYQ